MSLRTLAVTLLLSFLVGCGSKKAKPAPDKPFTGAPVAVVVDKINKDSLDVSVYNFADRAVVMYWFLIRYKDADGEVMKIKPGTAFESETEHMSVSGNKYKTNPNSWSSLEISMLDVPEDAKTAEVIVKSVSAMAKDGVTIEEADLWSMEGIEWPAGNP